ncbi:MAG TPA: pilus assembly protein PilP [Thermoanaerobaculia bacterium]|jgi:type IV pilus assembly protein PilP|nr:pilus assembly protein PilP [Thermoanaerobaculia bacterium]
MSGSVERMKSGRFLLSLAIVIAAVATVMAQTRPGGSPPAKTTTAAAATSTTATTATTAPTSTQQSLEEILEEPQGAETYRYDPQGRRDPFRSLVGPAPRIEPGQRPPGVPGFLIDEMKLTGIVRTRQGPVGVVSGPDNKGYLIRVGDKVLDGEVIRITASAVVFRQEVNDPTRIERYREVVKDLTPPSEQKR